MYNSIQSRYQKQFFKLIILLKEAFIFFTKMLRCQRMLMLYLLQTHITSQPLYVVSNPFHYIYYICLFTGLGTSTCRDSLKLACLFVHMPILPSVHFWSFIWFYLYFCCCFFYLFACFCFTFFGGVIFLSL